MLYSHSPAVSWIWRRKIIGEFLSLVRLLQVPFSEFWVNCGSYGKWLYQVHLQQNEEINILNIDSKILCFHYFYKIYYKIVRRFLKHACPNASECFFLIWTVSSTIFIQFKACLALFWDIFKDQRKFFGKSPVTENLGELMEFLKGITVFQSQIWRTGYKSSCLTYYCSVFPIPMLLWFNYLFLLFLLTWFYLILYIAFSL